MEVEHNPEVYLYDSNLTKVAKDDDAVVKITIEGEKEKLFLKTYDGKLYNKIGIPNTKFNVKWVKTVESVFQEYIWFLQTNQENFYRSANRKVLIERA